MNNNIKENFWFTKILDAAEAELRKKQIPQCFWGYISANGAPGTKRHDGKGAIFNSRADFVEVMEETKGGMGVTVVDGRDLDTIRAWIGGEDWTPEEEQEWLEMMDDAEYDLNQKV